jgi:hypothetical protein
MSALMNKLLRQHAALIFSIQPGACGKPLDNISNKTATGTGGAFAADFFMVEKGTEAGCIRFFSGEQGAQRGMTGGEVVELAVGNKLLTGNAPEAAFLRVVSVQFPGQQIARLNPEGLGNGLAETSSAVAPSCETPSSKGNSVCLLNLRPFSLTSRFM